MRFEIAAHVTPKSGHNCLMLGKRFSDLLLAPTIIRTLTYLRSGIELAITIVEMAGSRPRRTPQPTSWEPTLGRAKHYAQHIPF